MKFYELNEYLVIIHYTNFETSIRNIKKENLESFIEKLNKCDEVFDYVITRKIDYEY